MAKEEVKEEKVEEVKVEEPVVEVKASEICPDCGGRGLLNQDTECVKCNGSGRI